MSLMSRWLGTLLLMQLPLCARAMDCVAPDAAKSSEVVTYLVKKYQIASTSNLILTASAKANEACFWKMEYTSTSPKQSYVLYLSPDRKYLSPILYDLSLDPLAEMRAKNDALSRTCWRGRTLGWARRAPR